MKAAAEKTSLLSIEVIAICAVLFSLFTVFTQVRELTFEWVNESQILRHRRVLEGNALDPWQYRVLPEVIAEATIRALDALAVGYPVASAFILFRFVQNTAIFVVAAFYYRKLGLDIKTALLGLGLLAWSMSHALYASDLSFDVYFDVLFYLLAGLTLLHDKHAWIIPITLVAALNRETSGLIPFLLLAMNLRHGPQTRVRWQTHAVAITALCIYAGVFLGLRAIIGDRPLFVPYGNRPGLELLRYNLGRFVTWFELFGTLGVIPFIALATFRQWPPALKLFLWVIVPLWLLVHAFASVMAETRLFLVPQAMIFIPGALLGISRTNTPRANTG